MHRVFTKILTKRGGLAVKHTEDVEEVMAIAQNHEVDVVLMDVSLAHSMYQGKPMDGIKITQMLKANPDTANLPGHFGNRPCYGWRSRELSYPERGRWLYLQAGSGPSGIC
jgi:response regulator RpfG family c-di-GMP phosphodiesterase